MSSLSLFKPLDAATRRTTTMLFRPFRAVKWLALGFTAWLANLCERGSSWSPFHIPSNYPQVAINWVHQEEKNLFDMATTGIGVVILLVFLLIALVVWLVVLWINSRGKFMFLHNVMNDTSEIRRPWANLATWGNSLFFWRVGFGATVFAVVLLLLLPLAFFIYVARKEGEMATYLVPAVVVAAIFLVLALLVFAVAAAYTDLLLVDFIVPIMYLHRIRTIAAWKLFLPLLRANFWHLVLYGLFRALLAIGVAILLLLVIAATCFCACCLLLIPYVNALLLLPVTIWIRSYSIEYLTQLLPELRTIRCPHLP